MLSRLLLASLLLWLLSAGGCTSVTSCAKGTLLVKVELDSVTAAADTLRISISVAGGAAKVKPIMHTPGVASGTIEVDFPAGYPHGDSVTIDIIALQAGVVLGENQAPLTLSPGCSNLTLMIGVATGTDLATSIDLTGLDLTGLDLSTGGDASPATDGPASSDGPAMLVDGSTGDLRSLPGDMACAGFTENCFNGVDDDCDGLVDCADPNCAATAVCEPTFAGAAYGATVGGVVAGPPSCPPGTQGTTSLYNSFKTTQDLCTGCTSDPSGTAEVDLYSDDDGTGMCDLIAQGNDQIDTEWSNGDTGCSGLATFFQQFGVNTFGLSNITCSTPTGTPSLPAVATDMTTQTFCNWGPTGGGCGPSMACVPKAGSGNHQCVLLNSPATCDSDYPTLTTWNTSFSDGRSCDDCSNASTDTSAEIILWADSGCAQSSEGVYIVQSTATPSNTVICTPNGFTQLAVSIQSVNCNPQPYPDNGTVTAAGTAKVLCCK